MYACGLRIGEAATVEIASVDSASLLLRIIGKGDKDRRVPLPQPMLDDLRRLWLTHRNQRWLCPDRLRTGPVSKNALWRTFRLSVRAPSSASLRPSGCACGCRPAPIPAGVIATKAADVARPNRARTSPWRFEDEPQDHRGDPERDRADPHPNQCFPHSYSASPVAQRPPATRVPRRTPQEAR